MTSCFEKGYFCQFTTRVFRERLYICVCAVFHFSFDGRMWDLIVPAQFLTIVLHFTV